MSTAVPRLASLQKLRPEDRALVMGQTRVVALMIQGVMKRSGVSEARAIDIVVDHFEKDLAAPATLTH